MKVMCVAKMKILIPDFKLSPPFECRTLSSGLFPGVCSLNAKVSEHPVCSTLIGGYPTYNDNLKLHIDSQEKFQFSIFMQSGPGSSVGIATGYGLDGPGIEFRWGRGFPHLSRPALGPTQPPV
jgi:hypothetical protein